MTTGTDICTDALRYAGITGQGIAASGEDIAQAVILLNDMLAEWSARRWLVYHLLDYSKVCNGAINYSIGLNGDINVATRPERIEAAYVRLLNGGNPTLYTDYPLEQIFSREDYSKITLKQMASFPYTFFYDAAYPLGFIYVWPLPNASYELHVLTRVILTRIDPAAPATNINLPPEYDGAIKFNLARRIRAAYRYPVSKELNALAANGINVISSNNFAVPTLEMPSALRRSSRYNFYSDTVR